MIYSRTTERGLPWHVVEAAINREIEWLRKAVSQNICDKVPGCDDCLYTFRKIALLIITGKIKAKELIAREKHDLWDDLTPRKGVNKLVRHGGEWHRKMMTCLPPQMVAAEGFSLILLHAFPGTTQAHTY